MQKLNFSHNWLYSPHDIECCHLPSLDDSSFQTVSVPHANKLLEVHKAEDFQKHIESYRFVSWYRKHFVLGAQHAGQRIAIEFEAVATVADVYVNGHFVGQHKGAYTTFSFDIGQYVKFDGSDNVIAVRVDSTRQPDIPPEGGNVDYLLFGGIVRDVNMIITAPLHIEWAFITTPGLDSGSGRLNIQAKIKNSGNSHAIFKIETTLQKAEGTTMLTSITKETHVAAGATITIEQQTDPIKNPRLWDIRDPYLHRATVRVIANGNCTDEYSSNIGFRYFEFKSEPDDANFYLNGRQVKINGINRHEQWPWVGRAVPAKLQIADADLIKSLGINAVRASHYPQKPEFISRCDEIGLLVFAEPPGWQHVGGQEWQNLFAHNLEELIIRDRNHPSIISWGTRPNEAPTSGEADNACKGFFQKTNDIAKKLDPSRPTHGVRVEFLYEQSELFQEDIYTVNYRYPQKPKFTPFMVTEHTMSWGQQGMAGATDAQAMGWIDDWAKSLDYIFGNNLVAGGFGWSLFDYNNEVNYTKTQHVFPSGLYDIFRHEKPVSWLYRSQKSPAEEIVLYIANYWTAESPSRVLVLSNCEEVELFVGEVSKGRIKPNRYKNLPNPIYEFTGIDFCKNTSLRAVGYIDGKPAGEMIRKTPEEAARLVVTPDYSNLIADGVDMTAVSIKLVDANGTTLAYAANEISISITGPGKFIGQPKICLEGGRVGFILQSEYQRTGEITCMATAQGVEPGQCAVIVQLYN
ncbi:MAG: DUF4982 domain-containing protein [Defluviitaleaceae bacterium]|nr:DUF4982 domain-containing protein [Defluviitaleaceae bacterium]